MSIQHKTLSISLLSLFILSFATSVLAHQRGSEQHLTMLKDALTLTQEQTQAIRGVMENNQPKTSAIKKRIRKIKHELHDYLQGGSVDQAQVEALNVQIAKEKAQMQMQRIETQKQIAQFLSEEQQSKLKTLHLNPRKMHKYKHQHRHQHKHEHKDQFHDSHDEKVEKK